MFLSEDNLNLKLFLNQLPKIISIKNTHKKKIKILNKINLVNEKKKFKLPLI